MRSRRRNSATSWRASTGVIHSERGALMRQGDSVPGSVPTNGLESALLRAWPFRPRPAGRCRGAQASGPCARGGPRSGSGRSRSVACAGDQRRGGDRASAACDREDAPRTLWPAQRARRSASSTRWSCNSRNSRRRRRRTSSRRSGVRQARRSSRSPAEAFRKPFPDHLPRERILVPGPSACACCGSTRLAKLGEDITETLEVVPRHWKVLQYVREKFTCRACEGISQRQPLPRAAARLRRPEPARHGAVREVRPAPALEPAGGALCP